jgi:MarR family transcriptional regulator, organic hydroperoxide resistance regulator
MTNYYTDNLYYATVALSREVANIAETAFLDLGLTPSDAYLVMVVNEKPNIQPTEISEKILLAPSTITRMIEKLEKRQIVERSNSGKYTYVSATAKGKTMYADVLSKWDEIQQRYLERLGREGVSGLVTANIQAVQRLKV